MTDSIWMSEFWYTAVLRSMGPNEADPNVISSRRLLGWTRVHVWASYDLIQNKACAMVLRSPEKIKQEFFAHFQEPSQAAYLTRHPMLLHAIMMEDMIIETYDFLFEFSKQIYALVGNFISKKVSM